jgi:hypothetical protein
VLTPKPQLEPTPEAEPPRQGYPAPEPEVQLEPELEPQRYSSAPQSELKPQLPLAAIPGKTP